MTEHNPAGRNVLVVTMDEDVARAAAPLLGESDNVKVVVPVVGQGFLDWLSNDEKAFAHADGVATRLADELPGDTADARAGESDVALAIRDALATFRADEIVVAVAGDELGDAVGVDEIGGSRSVEGIPVRIVRTS